MTLHLRSHMFIVSPILKPNYQRLTRDIIYHSPCKDGNQKLKGKRIELRYHFSAKIDFGFTKTSWLNYRIFMKKKKEKYN